MTKQELVERVHEAAGDGLTRKATAELIDATFDNIVGSLKGDGKFFMPNFGTFSKKDRAARTGRNPRTGSEIQIPSSSTIGFKAAAGLKGSL